MLKRSKRRPHHPRQLEILYYEVILQLLGRHRRCSDGLSRARFRFGDFRRLRGSTSWKRGGRTVVVVLATFALAVILTLDARLEALTILLQARALFAMATLGVTRIVACISHDFALERIRVALLNLLSRLRHDGLVLRRVLALLTRAILAKGAGGEAFAVQLETFALLAVALLTRNELSARTGILHGTRVRCQTGVLRRRAAALRYDSLGCLHAAARRASATRAHARRIRIEVLQSLRVTFRPFDARASRARTFRRRILVTVPSQRPSSTWIRALLFDADDGIIKLVVHVLQDVSIILKCLDVQLTEFNIELPSRAPTTAVYSLNRRLRAQRQARDVRNAAAVCRLSIAITHRSRWRIKARNFRRSHAHGRDVTRRARVAQLRARHRDRAQTGCTKIEESRRPEQRGDLRREPIDA